MRKEYIVSKIKASQDGSPYLYLVLTDTKGNFTSTRRQQGFPENSFGVAAIPITSLDDLKDLPKKISDAIEGAFGDGRNNISSSSSSEFTTFKMNTREYEELGIKIGDKITLEFNLSNNNDSKV
jgi:hypothetical protein